MKLIANYFASISIVIKLLMPLAFHEAILSFSPIFLRLPLVDVY